MAKTIRITHAQYRWFRRYCKQQFAFTWKVFTPAQREERIQQQIQSFLYAAMEDWDKHNDPDYDEATWSDTIV